MVASAGPVVGQDRAADANVFARETRPALWAARLEGAVRIDGRLDEPSWSQAQAATVFTQLDPDRGQPASERTEVRILLSEDAIYVGVKLYDSEPSRIRARLGRRDAIIESDLFEVALDSYHDHRTAFLFGTTPAGAIRDALVTSNGTRDYSWDPVWYVATSVDSLGWIAELRIPLSQLRYNVRSPAVWGIQFLRVLSRRQESAVFSFDPRGDQDAVSRFGHLNSERLMRTRPFELVPYAAARAEYLQIPADDPFRRRGDRFGGVGMDLKYGLTKDFTINATVNPDFGQAEVDPSVINLSPFETFFPERRSFFVEGGDIFRFGDVRADYLADFPRVFHSRRIGRPPHRSLAGEGRRFVDSLSETSIVAALKLSGRTSGGWSVGILDAATAPERVRFMNAAGRSDAALVEPRTNYFLARNRREFRGGKTMVGAIATAVHRGLADSALNVLLPSAAYVAGVDINHAWGDRVWQLDGSLLFSRIGGDPRAILLSQQSSARYFQRPDARHVRLDAARTTLSGHGLQLGFSKAASRHGLGSLVFQQSSPGLETNDLGFATQVDFRSVTSAVTYKDYLPGRLLRRYRVTASARQMWNFDGDVIFAVRTVGGQVRLHNYWEFGAQLRHYPPYYDNFSSQGGPLIRIPPGPGLVLNVASDTRKSYSVGGSLVQSTFRGGYAYREISAFLDIRQSSAIRVRLEPKLLLNSYTYQYVTTVEDPTNLRTYGHRYVFAQLRQTELSLLGRLDWTFTPRLSLQVFLQPLVSVGAYRGFKELRRSKSFDFMVYGTEGSTIGGGTAGDLKADPDGTGPAPPLQFEDPSFNVRAFQGNAVLRWEYRPGSTLFVVWQQARHSTGSDRTFNFGRDYSGIFEAPGENTFLVKASYWIGK